MEDFYFVDAHTHLHRPWFDHDFDEVVSRAKENKVLKIVNCSSDPTSFDQVLKQVDKKNVFATLGLQPTLAKEFTDVEILRAIEEIEKQIVAIGEVGLDYYWVKDKSVRRLQERLFIDAIDFSNEIQLPLVIHSRKAENECLDILEKHANVPVLLHSFDGNLKQIRRALDLGYLITVPTIVTRRKNRRKVTQRAGIENIMIETDAPFCAIDESIERNEPKYIPRAAEYIATLLDMETKEVAYITSNNAEGFYHI